jgi:hypothetical protein
VLLFNLLFFNVATGRKVISNQGDDVELEENWRSLGGYGIKRGDAQILGE